MAWKKKLGRHIMRASRMMSSITMEWADLRILYLLTKHLTSQSHHLGAAFVGTQVMISKYDPT